MPSNGHSRDTVPLVVDLDGTLIPSDLLWEGCVRFLLARPAQFWRLPVWLLRGRAVLKRELAARVRLDPGGLVYRQEVIRLIESARSQGRRVVLATASPRPWAEAVAGHLKMFDQVLATESVNLKGREKLAAIVESQGEAGFDYAGDSCADLPLFEKARTAYYCGGWRCFRKLKAMRPDAAAVREGGMPIRDWVRQLRLRQWVKNTLLAVPLIASGRAVTAETAVSLLLGFLGFSLCASAVYCVNDLLDLPHDRKHPEKRSRPLARGAIEPSGALLASGLLLAAGLGISLFLPWQFVGLLAAYCCLSAAYVAWLKRIAALDVFSLAGLYTLRLFAGAFLFAEPIVLSTWLLAFSVFLFSSLALAKRAAELILTLRNPDERLPGRDYAAQDLETIRALGVACGVIAVLVLALYVEESAVAARLYAHPRLLLLLCLPLLAWVARLWVQLGRGQMTDDPVVFVFADRGSRILFATSVAAYAAARFLR